MANSTEKPYTLEIDPQVISVLQFMVQNIQADDLVAVSKTVSDMAPILWSRYKELDRSSLPHVSLNAPTIQ